MTVKIEKPWEKHSDQVVHQGEKRWGVSQLIDQSKDLPVMDIPMEHLCFDREIATIAEMPIREFVGHMMLVMEADMKHPIIMGQDGDIFDGKHRIARALFDKMESIKAVRFEKYPDPTHYCEDKDAD